MRLQRGTPCAPPPTSFCHQGLSKTDAACTGFLNRGPMLSIGSMVRMIYDREPRCLGGWDDLTSPQPSPLHPMERRGGNIRRVWWISSRRGCESWFLFTVARRSNSRTVSRGAVKEIGRNDAVDWGAQASRVGCSAGRQTHLQRLGPSPRNGRRPAALRAKGGSRR